jgi:predicted O-methyltransferase YrrM
MSSFGGSLLANTFNQAWCGALNYQKHGRDITHFAMLHDDVVPLDGWLATLLEDLRDSGADLVSACIPIKDQRGLVSTAIDDPSDPFCVERRLTMEEVFYLPSVFMAKDTSYPDRMLLVNTGCWVCHFTRPWRFRGHFEINDRIVYRLPDGRRLLQEEAARLAERDLLPPGEWSSEVDPEDWNFSRQIQRAGAVVAASRRVVVSHVGILPYPNNHPWGDMKQDGNLVVKHKGKNILSAAPPPDEPIIPGEVKKETVVTPEGQRSVTTPEPQSALLARSVVLPPPPSQSPIPTQPHPIGSADGPRFGGTVQRPLRRDSYTPPDNVFGWLTDTEGRFLTTLAEGKEVLEIGSYLGLSTVWIGRVAKRVTCVDPFDGRGTSSPRDTFEEFCSNLNRHEVKVRIYRGTSQDFFREMEEENLGDEFDVIFIDGSHERADVMHDLEQSARRLGAGGIIVVHDYLSTSQENRGVTEAVGEFLDKGGFRLLRQVGTLAAIGYSVEENGRYDRVLAAGSV